MPSENTAILIEAASRNSAAVISLPSAGMLRHHKTRLLGSSEEGFWLEAPPGDRPLIDELLASGRAVGVSFKSGMRKVALVSALLKLDPMYRMNEKTVLPALLMAHPQAVKAEQRRAAYRVMIGCDSGFSARVWRIGPYVSLADRPMPSQEMSIEAKNLSIGGLGIQIRRKAEEPMHAITGERLRIELRYGDIHLLLEGTLRCQHAVRADSPMVSAGVQFKRLEQDIAGRQNLAALTRIVGELQRDEVRRARLGLTG